MQERPSEGIEPKNLDIISSRIPAVEDTQAKVDITRLVDEVNRLRSVTIASGRCPDCEGTLTTHQSGKYCSDCNSYMEG